MELACLDLEGVLIPEIWIAFAEKTGIEELKATTRDIPDYDVLMKQRLKLLDQHGYGLPQIQEVIGELDPLPGAREFLDWLRERFQVVILSDTFYEFAMPLMKKLGYPALLCHKLEVADAGQITNYLLRQRDPNRQSVRAFQLLNYRVIAAWDSYNDTTMLGQAEAGILFHAPQNVIDEFPQFPAVHNFDDLRQEFLKASAIRAEHHRDLLAATDFLNRQLHCGFGAVHRFGQLTRTRRGCKDKGTVLQRTRHIGGQQCLVQQPPRTRGHGHRFCVRPAVARRDDMHSVQPEVPHRTGGSADVFAHLGAHQNKGGLWHIAGHVCLHSAQRAFPLL